MQNQYNQAIDDVTEFLRHNWIRYNETWGIYAYEKLKVEIEKLKRDETPRDYQINSSEIKSLENRKIETHVLSKL